jgi:hypothetical protein
MKKRGNAAANPSFLKFVVVKGGTRPHHPPTLFTSDEKRGEYTAANHPFLPSSNSLLSMGERGRKTQMVNG